MNAYQIIKKKRDAKVLNDREIEWFIHEFTHGEIMDYQAAALLMAIFINGMNEAEILGLTKAMTESGQRLVFNDPTVVDKHSTGGIGDKTSFIVGPIAASCGAKVPMIAGRGLGHTGGTIDKAASIPGFNSDIDFKDFPTLLEKNHIILAGQTSEIAPADKKLYALRDVTATISSIPLITASIMSKKLAEGISGLTMDIKYGSGAFLQELDECRKLAQSIMKVGKLHGLDTMVFISSMDTPLGNTVGHSLEVIECIETMKGDGPSDLKELSVTLAAGMIFLARPLLSFEEAHAQALEALESGVALKKFEQLIRAQEGNANIISDPSLLSVAEGRYQVKARTDGYIESFQTDQIGLLALELGGGRKRKEDAIDFSVGLKFSKKPGDSIKAGDTIFTFYHHKSQEKLVQSLEERFFQCIMKVSEQPPKLGPLIADVFIEKFNTK